MYNLLRKHWTSLLGVLFVLTAFVTLFKYTIDQGWITDWMKIGVGLLIGAGLSIIGLKLAGKQKWAVTGQIVLGLGASILYATFAFSGIYYRLWDSMTVLLGMAAVTAALTYYAYRFDSRLVMNIALAGGLLSPLLMRPETDQVFTLFLYLLVMNSAFLFMSIVKGWSELRTASFIGSWLMYIVYFFQFTPDMDGMWSMPFRYALAAFLFYQIGLLVSSWMNKLYFDGLNLYLSLVNGVMFGFWALLLLNGDIHYGYPLAFIGVIYIVCGTLINRLLDKIEVASAVYWSVGFLLVLLAVNQAGSGMEIQPLVSVLVWGGVAVALALIGQYKRWILLTIFSLGIWFIVGFYWYIVTWSTPRGEWFGTYIPFLNWSAMAWFLLAGLGFYFSMRVSMPSFTQSANRVMSNVYALLSHLIVGGLLTRQIENIFTEYFVDAPSLYLNLSLTLSWGIYALILILWGAYRQQSLFRWFGASVLVLTAIKAIFMDLSGKESLYKVVVLLVLGGISFLITWINGKWAAAGKEVETEESKLP
ncbi:MAG: DUF2339 domain-containing protein [Candidatus Pristimantibacillus sp.]